MQALELQLMKSALEYAHFGLCVVDESGRIIIANSAFLQKIGAGAEDVIGESYLSLQRFLGRHQNFFKLFNVKEAGVSVEFTVTNSDGVSSYLLAQSSSVKHSSDERFRTISLIDVTDYGISRDRLVELSHQMDALNSAVVVVDARAKDMPITYVNKHFERMTGYTSNETIGRNCRFLQGQDNHQSALLVLRDAIAKQKNCRVTLKNYRKDGTAFKNELFISPVFDDQGTLTNFIGVQREVHASEP